MHLNLCKVRRDIRIHHDAYDKMIRKRCRAKLKNTWGKTFEQMGQRVLPRHTTFLELWRGLFASWLRQLGREI